MYKIKPNYAYAIVWNKEARKLYGVSSYRREIWCSCLTDEAGEEHTPLMIFETRKMARGYLKSNPDAEIDSTEVRKVFKGSKRWKLASA